MIGKILADTDIIKAEPYDSDYSFKPAQGTFEDLRKLLNGLPLFPPPNGIPHEGHLLVNIHTYPSGDEFIWGTDYPDYRVFHSESTYTECEIAELDNFNLWSIGRLRPCSLINTSLELLMLGRVGCSEEERDKISKVSSLVMHLSKASVPIPLIDYLWLANTINQHENISFLPSDALTPSTANEYVDYIENSNTLRNQANDSLSCDCSSIYEVILASLEMLTMLNKRINKCELCDRYFVPSYRSDEIYCEFPNPKYPDKTCREASKLLKTIANNNVDEAARIIKRLKGRLFQKGWRAGYLDAQKAYNQLLTDDKTFRINMKSGKTSREEYEKWVKEMDEKYPKDKG